QKLLGSDEWDILAELCQEDTMHLELMSKLLDTERDYYTKVRRVGLYKDLEKCFETSSLSKEEAIAQAHLKRNIKQAASRGDVAAMKKYLAGETVDPLPEEQPKQEQLPLLALEEKQKQDQGKTWGNIKFKKGKSEN
ncbi:MAG: DNA phosphorothioation system sulfurtransferase DndC, partial [Microcystaceae cyanobacterium]